MNRQIRPLAMTLLAVSTAFAVFGCGGPSSVRVSGKLLMNGQPLNVSKKTIVTLTFAPDMEQKGAQTKPATFSQETGQYQIEVPPGKYRVTCLLRDTENNKKIPTAEPKVYDLSTSKVLDIDVTPE